MAGEPITLGALIPSAVQSSQSVSGTTDSKKPVSMCMLDGYPPCDISPVGAKSCIETVDTHPSVYHMWAYHGFISNKSTSSTRV